MSSSMAVYAQETDRIVGSSDRVKKDEESLCEKSRQLRKGREWESGLMMEKELVQRVGLATGLLMFCAEPS